MGLRLRRLALGLGALAALYLTVTFGQVWWTGRTDDRSPTEAIVVLGAAQYDGRPSPVLEARLAHALELWEAGVAPVIVVTGGRQEGDRVTEAAAAAAWLGDRGVPDAAIRREVDGRSSWESLAAAARFLRAEGVDRVTLVSDPFHSLRLRGIAREVGLTAVTSPTATSPIDGLSELEAMTRETAAVGLGRVIGYRRLTRWLG